MAAKDFPTFITDQMEKLKEEIFTRQLQRQPHLSQKYPEEKKKKCLQDIEYHLSYLSQAISVKDVLLFEDYMAWVRVLFEELNLPLEEMQMNLKIIQEVLTQHCPPEEEILALYIEKGVQGLTRPPSRITFLEQDNPHLKLAESYLQSLLTRERDHSLSLVLSQVKEGVPVKDIYTHVFQPVLREVGYLWQRNRLSVAREHYCSATTQFIMSHLYPYILNPSSEKSYRCITFSVSGELHELGIRMVADLLEMEGWDTLHLGANTPRKGILEMIQEKKVDLLAISATLTMNLKAVREIITAVKKASLPVKIMVGGYPFNISPHLWQRVGAHGSASDAQQAVQTAKDLVKGPTKEEDNPPSL